MIPLSDLVVDDEILTAAQAALASGWWSMGPRVQAFELAFAELCGARHALAVANGTAALHLALVATGCGPGDEVILPSLNFVAAANSIRLTGATPVFCDIAGERDLNLDSGDLEAAVGPRTKAVIVLHYGGYPCDMESVNGIAKRRGLTVIEDAAHAPGASLGGVMCGTLGNVGCFSFFSNKNLPIGEGGMLVTDDDSLAERLRLLRSHGMTTLTWQRHKGHASSYDVLIPGFNYRLDEVRAAVGLVQLERLPSVTEARRRLANRYRASLDGVAGINMPFTGAAARGIPAHHLAVVLLPTDVPRDVVRGALAQQRIQTSVHYPPTHDFSAYEDVSQRPLPRTDAVAGRLLTLPLFPHLGEDQADRVIEALLAAVSAGRR